ncbi:DUF1127 domain-containing protein [Halodurantibacterium flavum]|uniref:DUF1127 domain-containing protein n=1 Tax=Halodurantibacterium flavum TaxID=1382802 RepID=A0ABW4S7M9_9RHOB
MAALKRHVFRARTGAVRAMQNAQGSLAPGALAYTNRCIYVPIRKQDASKNITLKRTKIMATFEPTRTAPFGAIAVLRIVQLFEAGISRLSDWNQVRVTRKELSRLTDRELDDIGLCRSDIEFVSARRTA